MDVIEPCLVWVDGRRYRFYESNFWSGGDPVETQRVVDSNFQEVDNFVDRKFDDSDEYDDSNGAREFVYSHPQEFDDSDDRESINSNDQKIVCSDIQKNNIKEEKSSMDIVIEPTGRSKYVHKFVINKRYFPFIIGKSGIVKRRLERQTNTWIRVPRNFKDDQIAIIGATEESIVFARREIDGIINHFAAYLKRCTASGVSSVPKVKTSGVPSIPKVETSGVSSIPKVETSDAPSVSKVEPSVVKINSYGDTSNDENFVGPTDVRLKISDSSSNRTMKNSIGWSIRPARKLFTHFISVPMTCESVVSNFVKFKNNLLCASGNDFQGVRDKIFSKPGKLHIPLGMLSLNSDRVIKAAREALEDCKEMIIKPFIEKTGPIRMRAQGLECIVRTSDVNVLYCRLRTKNNELKHLAEKIVEFFILAGLMEKPRKQLEIRMTLMNVAFDKKTAKKFCAKNILREYKDYFFGENELRTIHLSERGNYSESGYYSTTAKIDIP